MKHKSLIYLLASWELLKSLLAYLAASAGLVLPVWPAFRSEFPIPRLWPSTDMVLPHPYLNLDPGYLLNLVGTDRFYQALVLLVLVLLVDTCIKALFIGQLVAVFQGKKLELRERWLGITRTFNRYFILAWCIIIWQFIGNISSQVGMPTWLLYKSVSIVVAVLFIFVDIAIQYHDLSIPAAFEASLKQHQQLGNKGIRFILLATVLLGCFSIPLNWTLGFYPAFMLGIVAFANLGAIIAAGLVYLYTATEQVEQLG